jgi:hypothetical protein
MKDFKQIAERYISNGEHVTVVFRNGEVAFDTTIIRNENSLLIDTFPYYIPSYGSYTEDGKVFCNSDAQYDIIDIQKTIKL